MKNSLFGLLGVFALAAPLGVPGQIITSTSGNFDGWVVLFAGQAFATSWEQSDGFENVAVSAELTGFGLTDQTGRAFLTTRLGPDTTAADLVASSTFLFPATESYVTLFSGLNLPAGSYYLSLVGDSLNWGSGWIGSDSPTIENGLGTTLGFSYGFSNPAAPFLPSSPVWEQTWRANFQVESAPVPEPAWSGAGFILIMLSAIGLRRIVALRGDRRLGRANEAGG